MSILALPPNLSPVIPSLPDPKRWTVEEFHRLWNEGWFEGKCPMLVDGEIFVTPNPNAPHNTGVGLADYLLKNIFSPGCWVRVQMPLVLGQDSDPVPDLAVVVGSPRDYSQNPTTALLVIEVSDSTLAFDTGEKANLYSAGGIQDYWVVDLNARQLIVHRDPIQDGSQRFGYRYATILTLDENATISPLAASTSIIRIADLLP